MFNLNEFMDNRGIFKMVTFADVELEIVSLGQDLIDGLKTLPAHEMMIDYVAEHGLAHRGIRISEGDKAEALLVIWNKDQMRDAKDEIVNAICELSDITEILTDKKDEEELKVMEDEDDKNKIKEALANNPHIELAQLEADNEVEKL